jgi:outer membrane protein TolC
VDQKKEVEVYRKVLDRVDSAGRQFSAGAPLSLEQALELANEHNERLAISGEDYLQALIEKDRVAARFLPTIDLAPSYTISDPVGNAPISSTDVLDVPVGSSMKLFNGFSDVAKLNSAKFTIEQRRNLLLDVQATVLLDVARTYYRILSAERSVEVLVNSLKVQEERVRDIQARQQAGLARPLDVAQTEAAAASARVSLVQARSDVRNGRSVLGFLVGTAVQDSALADQFQTPGSILSLPEAVALGQRQRGDLAGARAGVQAAEQNVKAAVGQYYPSVGLDLNYLLYRQSAPRESDWNGVLSANVPIFSGGVIHANVRTAWSELRQAVLSESLLERQVTQEVQIGYDNVTASEQRLGELRTQLAAAADAFRQAEQSYNVGLATNLERLTAQDRLLSTQLQLTNEEFARKIAYLNLLRVMGRFSLQTGVMATTQPTTKQAD